MASLLDSFLLAFIPLFVAIDAVGVLPIYTGLAEGIKPAKRQRVIGQALVTALALCAFFLFLGQAIFNLLGITLYDFMIAGGLILFGIALRDLLGAQRLARTPDSFGVVPLGTPLIAGPAVFATTLMMAGQYGATATLLAILVNLALTGIILWQGDRILRLVGVDGARAGSKVAHLLLAAIAVMLVRKGLFGMLAH